MRNRGTDCVKSPEMLLVSNAQKKARNPYDRRHEKGAGMNLSQLCPLVVVGTHRCLNPVYTI